MQESEGRNVGIRDDSVCRWRPIGGLIGGLVPEEAVRRASCGTALRSLE